MLRIALFRALCGAICFHAACFVAGDASALDYYLNRKFDNPVGGPASGGFGDRVIYNSLTGEVTYEVSSGRLAFWPPDLVSKSGAFVAPVSFPTVPFSVRTVPEFRTGETISNEFIAASNGFHIEFDGYIFWPIPLNDPRLLANWNLPAVPDAYHFGAILPKGLTESFLRSDIYAFPQVELIYQIPEPSTAAILLVASPLSLARRRRRK